MKETVETDLADSKSYQRLLDELFATMDRRGFFLLFRDPFFRVEVKVEWESVREKLKTIMDDRDINFIKDKLDIT